MTINKYKNRPSLTRQTPDWQTLFLGETSLGVNNAMTQTVGFECVAYVKSKYDNGVKALR